MHVDKKDVIVWKLAESVSKPDFRHWCDTVCANLEAVHKFAYPDVVFDKLRRQEVEVTQGNWHVVIAQANEELLRMGESPIDLASAWSFAEKGRFFWTYLLSKLNTELHGKSISIEGRNGFELYRQVVRAVDDIPENAKFLMGAELSDMVKRYGDKVKDLKSMYGFRLLLKKRAAEYKTYYRRGSRFEQIT